MINSPDILRLIRDGEAATRSELMDHTGLSRTTIGTRLGDLKSRGLITENGSAASTGGRPSGLLAFNAGAGVVLVMDAGATRTTLAVADLAGETLAERSEFRGIDAGPEETLAWAVGELNAMLAELGRSAQDVWAVGVGLPGSVDGHGRPVSPGLMPGWDGFPVAERLREHFDVDVLVANDVNVMALGEARAHDRGEQIVVLKAGTGVGLAYVASGVILRGAQGAAGEIGHTRVPGHDDIECSCGKRGCLQAVAGGTRMAQRLSAAGIPCANAAEIAALARGGTPEAIAMVREAGHAIGFVLATVVNILNPSRVVVAGDLTDARDFLLSALRETLYREANTLATSELEISRARAGARAGLIGATTMAVDHALSPY
ncbi:ROK family transcriptional regulator [Solirubrobacter sp. CPCC 204708]|uniref:ROK family transcriptional regulator n=1 Tax=Solirubrobacter deserti TaxID=2282478 RepID=A0ABT4RUT4_9ACTN|nr:ROK family transcriptional regulator [Solirubrobacter deserti]MBE2315950.1 ROK family transcriptional regulator [Solirubrobacter deserti]MDA0142334.1 ROK family transcriptional regulator [Solirubrobacter deserti]